MPKTYTATEVEEIVRECLGEIKEWNNDRVKECYKTCLSEKFDNGCFWEAKEMQQYLLSLHSQAPEKLKKRLSALIEQEK